MAIKPDAQTVKRIKDTARKARQRKVARQRAIGHGTDFTDHGPGVIPEPVWKELQAHTPELCKADGLKINGFKNGGKK